MRKREGHDINPSFIFGEKVASKVDEVRPGAGRCVEAKAVPASERGAAFLPNGMRCSPLSTYKARVA